MRDDEIVSRITELVDQEHELRRALHTGSAIDDEGRSRLGVLEVQLDQCWDLLRQRRALREVGLDPDDAEVRPPQVVENYEQ